MAPEPIEVDGVPAVLWGAEGARGSAIVLPGRSQAAHRLGGTPARPDLHFTRSLLLSHSLAVLELWWHAEAAPAGDAVEVWLGERARSVAAAAPAPLRLAVGRSFGSRALAKLVLGGEAPPTLVWVAPLLFHEDVREAVAQAAPGSCVVAGTADEATPAEHVRGLEEAGATVVRIAGANHGFETGGGAAADARALGAALEGLDAFLRVALAAGDTV